MDIIAERRLLSLYSSPLSSSRGRCRKDSVALLGFITFPAPNDPVRPARAQKTYYSALYCNNKISRIREVEPGAGE